MDKDLIGEKITNSKRGGREVIYKQNTDLTLTLVD